MLVYDLSGAYFRRHIEGYRLIEPRRHNHTGLIALYVTESARHDIPHAVYKPHIHRSGTVYIYLNALFGYELRLGGHYCSSGGGLRQLVVGALLLVVA